MRTQHKDNDMAKPKGHFYIPWVIGLTKRLEVLQMAAMLGRDRRFVAACCCEVWEWADARPGCPWRQRHDAEVKQNSPAEKRGEPSKSVPK